MATKFITIRIPIPSLSWFKKEEEQSYVASDDFAARILEIQTRIAAFKRSFERREKSNKTTPLQPKQLVEESSAVSQPDTVRQQKEQELKDMKAKLLGKNK